MAEAGAAARWLAVHRHRLRGFAAPYLLILQHPIVESRTRIVAPVVPAGPEPPTLLAPQFEVGAVRHKAMLLDMTSVPLGLLGEAAAAVAGEDAVAAGLDAIFRGYPVGLPLR